MTYDADLRRKAAILHNYAHQVQRAIKFYRAGLVMTLLGAFLIASWPWIDWAAIVLGLLFFVPGVGLIFKWRRIVEGMRTPEYLAAVEEAVEATTNIKEV